jgi:diaminopimelate decarboxylase
MTEISTYKKLVGEYGSPLFIFYPDRFRANIASYRQAFEAAWPNVTIAYSTKTNYLPRVVKTAAEDGVVLEAIPGFELDVLERLGLLDAKAIINGPLKTKEELQKIVAVGARINVDNITELEVLNEVAGEAGRIVDIGLRVSGQISDDSWLRYGFDIDSGDALMAAKKITAELKHLRLIGLHIHLGTNILDTEIYRSATEKVCSLSVEMQSRQLIELKYLDMGGGFATDCPFLDSDLDNWAVPSAEDYAAAICAPLWNVFGEDGPELIIEPGRALIDDTFELLTTVSRLRGSSLEAIADAGQNIFSSCRFRRHNISHLSPRGREIGNWTVFGPLCMPSDCLGRDVELPELQPGDLLKLDYAGAYSLSQAWQFIRYQPAIIAFENESATLIRRRESAETLFARDVF